MNCEDVEQQNILGAYLAGKLSEDLRGQFEEHFFACDQCLRQVEAGRLARQALIARRSPKKRIWIPLVAAAGLIVATGIWKLETPKPQAAAAVPASQPDFTRTYQLLARFEAPGYKPSTLRGADNQGRSFRDAMKPYAAGDYAAAVLLLSATVSAHPGLLEARYYLGISKLLSSDRQGGAEELQQVIAAGDTPFLSDARFYLAKALLAANNPEGAKRQLEILVKDQSELAPKATQILNQLPPTKINPAQ